MSDSALSGDSFSLFDTTGGWRHGPLDAFLGLVKSEEFIRSSNSKLPVPEGRKLRDNGALVYKAMFSKYLTALAERGVNFLDVTAEDFGVFFQGTLSELSQSTTARYLRLLERVYDYLVLKEIIPSNPVNRWVLEKLEARESIKVGRAVEKPKTITSGQVHALQEWLLQVGLESIKQDLWRDARDITLASLSLGSGLRFAELAKLTKKQVKRYAGNSVSERFDLDLPPAASVPTAKMHATRADEFCAELLEAWWEFRWSSFPRLAEVVHPQKPESLVFPATLKSMVDSGATLESPTVPRRTAAGTTGKTKTATLDASTINRAFRRLGKEAVDAGVLDVTSAWVLQSGAQGLRRAYALTCTQDGDPEQLVQFRMGHWTQRSARRFREQLGLPPVETPASIPL